MKSMKLENARQTEKENSAAISSQDRPMFHVSPRCGWMNDPNGFSFYKGEYHLFYQYNPYHSFWETMHWGHVVSRNLIEWTYKPAAMAPDMPFDEGGCYSGCAVEMKDGRQLLMYTGLRRPKDKDEEAEAAASGADDLYMQCQNLAFGDGTDYVKYEANPVIDGKDLPEGASRVDFRDPKIVKMSDGTYFCLIAGRDADRDGQIYMFRSKDCINWNYWKIFIKNEGRFGVMWECPDFFELDGKWILLTSPMEMEPKGLEYHNGAGSLALAGDFDEKTGTFTPQYDQAIDYGIDFYAAQSIQTPDGRRVMIGWMQNWDTCLMRDKRAPWAGQMTIPRELTFRDGRLYQAPVSELSLYYTNSLTYKKVPVFDEVALYGIEGRTIDMEITVRPVPDAPLYRKFAVWFAMDENKSHHTAVRFNPSDGTVKIDRKYAGSRKAVVHQRRCLVRESMDGNIRFRILLDRYSCEVFINDGRYVMSAILYTDLSAEKIVFRTEGKALIDVVKRDIRI